VILVDYAHTPDALEALLIQGRDLLEPGGRLLLVVGCGGERDRAKRPIMGEIASRLADHVLITTDNPRSEDAAAISAAIRSGCTGPAVVEEVPDRRAAIGRAVELGSSGDLVVIAGKGHERSQQIGEQLFDFDDRLEARRALGERGGRPC